jgi:hypothetical protein
MEIEPDRSTALGFTHLYSPSVLVGYSLLTPFTVPLFLLGMNVYRRGHKLTGTALATLAGLGTVGLVIRGVLAEAIPWTMAWATVTALLVLKLDSALYFQAVAKGASPARWWPPLLILAALVTVVKTAASG